MSVLVTFFHKINLNSRFIKFTYINIFRLRLKSSEGFALFVKISEKTIPVKDDNFFFDFVRQLTELLKKNKRVTETASLTYQGECIYIILNSGHNTNLESKIY